jgi:hypothetical protein
MEESKRKRYSFNPIAYRRLRKSQKAYCDWKYPAKVLDLGLIIDIRWKHAEKRQEIYSYQIRGE